MEQLSKFSRVVWMTIAGVWLLRIILTLCLDSNCTLPACADAVVYVLLGGWFTILYRNCNRKSTLYLPALFGMISSGIMTVASIMLLLKSILLLGSTGTKIYQIGSGIAYILFIVTFILIGRRVPAGKYRKAAYVAAFVPLIAAILGAVLSTAVSEAVFSSMEEFDWEVYNETLRRYFLCIGLISSAISYGAYAFFAYTMDDKK